MAVRISNQLHDRSIEMSEQEQYDPTQEITRRQFFARLRKLGFKKADLQDTRTAITYERKAGEATGSTPYDWRGHGEFTPGLPDAEVNVRITVPKNHTSIVQVMGGSYSGWHIEHGGKHALGSPIPEGWNLLATVPGLFNGGISVGR